MMSFLSVNELLDARARDDGDVEIINDPDSNFNYRRYTYKSLLGIASGLAADYEQRGIVPVDDANVIGILSKSGFHYIVNVLALLRLGWCVLYLSPNNSSAALAHLINITKASRLLIQPSFSKAAEDANLLLEADRLPTVAVALIEEKEKWEVCAYYQPKYSPQQESKRAAFIIHSSGSTGFPKPITISHSASTYNFAQNFDKTGIVTLPLYHAHGHCTFFRALHSKKRLCMYPSSLPLTCENLLHVIGDVQPQAFYAVPFVIKLLAERDSGIQALASMDLVTFGGAPCPDELGDILVNKGVNLVGHYGMTEVGQIMTSARDYEKDKGWNWVRLPKHAQPYVRWQNQGDGVLELVVLDGWPSKVLTNNADGSYSSKDLFICHPTIPQAFKCIGRLDDIITMVTGEKTNPIATELRLRESPLISEAIMFGIGKAACGVLILPSYVENRALSSLSESELVDMIFPEVQRVNRYIESHAQISRDMVRVLSPDAILPRADKGSILRPAVCRMFAKLIEDTYIAAESSSGFKAKISQSDLRVYLKQLILEVMSNPSQARSLQFDDDLFAFGVDSLQSARIRNAIQKHVELGGTLLGQNMIYENPSIDRMAAFIHGLGNGMTIDDQDEEEKMFDLVNKYSTFPKSRAVEHELEPSQHSPKLHHIILTGATGSLGAHILTQLLQRPSVQKVYCLCRAKDDREAMQRVQNSLSTRKLVIDEVRVVVLSSSLGHSQLGLTPQRYEFLAKNATMVIHNAWAVNFNISTESFEADHIRGVHNLLRLCLKTGAEFFFSSSISATVGLASPNVYEQNYESPSAAQGMGYARSKWVAERIVNNYSQATGLRAGVLRIGQLVGDSRNGIWNQTEAISLIIKSAETTGCLPVLDESPNWLPVDLAAKIICDLTFSSPQPVEGNPMWHVVSPHTSTSWKQILGYLAQSGLKFKEVDQWTWLVRLSASEPDPIRNPSIKLLGFYQNKYGAKEPRVSKIYGTQRVQQDSKTFRQIAAIDGSLVGKFVSAWKEVGFLS